METFSKFIVTTLILAGLVFAVIFSASLAKTLYTITTDGAVRSETADSPTPLF